MTMSSRRSPACHDLPLSFGAARIEAERLARFRAGDEEAFNEILAEHWDPIVRYAERMLGDRDLAHDVAQEAFIRLWLKRHEWTGSGAIGTFLYRVTSNLVIDESRKQRTRTRGSVARHARNDDSRTPRTPAAELDQAELREALDQAVGALPRRRRDVFVLYHFHNRSYREIAEILAIKPQVVANYMSAALTELRRTLRPQLSELLDR